MTATAPTRPTPTVANAVMTAAVVVNFALLAAATYWVYGDGGSRRALQSLDRRWSVSGESTTPGPTAASSQGTAGAWLVGAAVVAGGSLLVALGGLVVGPRRFRTLKAWGLMSAIAAGWLALVINWPSLHWYGQQRRISTDLAAAEELVRTLDDDWPTTDGQRDSIGGFLAYPKGAPRSLILMSQVQLPGSELLIAAIERTPDGAIALELTGREYGAWVEWRADDTPPKSYTSGLETPYALDRAVRLAPRWYLVQYAAE